MGMAKNTCLFVVIVLLSLCFNVQPVRGGTDYIEITLNGVVIDNGQPFNPRLIRDGNLYTFVSNISCDGIKIYKQGTTIIDGLGYMLCGNGKGEGYFIQTLPDANNNNSVTIRNTFIEEFERGIHFDSNPRNCLIYRNTIAACSTGVDLALVSSYSNNKFYHNSFIDNTVQVDINDLSPFDSNNVWDNGYPDGGNYWSNYTGPDHSVNGPPNQGRSKSDGIGDTPHHVIDTDDTNNVDAYPLMQPYLLSVRNWNSIYKYYTIQEAINDAANGNQISVASRVSYRGKSYQQPHYHDETLYVNKSVILAGDYSGLTVIDGIRHGNHVVTIAADQAHIKRFKIQNAGSRKYGIDLSGFDYSSISNNRIVRNPNGIRVQNGCGNHIVSNYMAFATTGIDINDCNNTLVYGNTVNSSSSAGIKIADSIDTEVILNNLLSNTDGIYLTGNSYDNTIRKNQIMILGNLNGRGKVDLIDLAFYAGRWLEEGLSVFSDNRLAYDNMADLDNSGRVELIDYALMALHWRDEVEEGRGIVIDSALVANTTIQKNRVSSKDIGIELNNTSNNTLCYNFIRYCNSGIVLNNVTDNTLKSNWILGNENNGIEVNNGSNGCNLIWNRISSNGDMGLIMDSCNDCNVAYNTIENHNVNGLKLYQSDECTIMDNNFKYNGNDTGAINLEYSNSNTIKQNVISCNYRGIGIQFSQGNKIYHNIFTNNYFGNHDIEGNYENNWDNGYICDPNHPSGGNFWDDYTGDDNYHGPAPQSEEGSDYPDCSKYGIIDEPYQLAENNVDKYPLILVPYKVTFEPPFPLMKQPYTVDVNLTNKAYILDSGDPNIYFTGLIQTKARPGSWAGWLPKPDWLLRENLDYCRLSPPRSIEPDDMNHFSDMSFTNRWNWVKPQDTAESAANLIIGTISTAASAIGFAEQCSGASKAVPYLTFTFEPFPTSTPVIRFAEEVTISVSEAKVHALQASVAAGGASLALGIAAPATGPAAPVFVASSVICGIGSILKYNEAADPDPNYTEVVEYCGPIDIPYEVNSLPEGNQKRLALSALELVSLLKACTESYIRYEYAKSADSNDPNEYYMALQLGATQRYNAMAIEKLEEVQFRSGVLIAELKLTPMDINDFRNDIADGLGDVEKQIIQSIFDANEPNEPNETDFIEMMLALTDPNDPNTALVREICGNPVNIAKMLQALVEILYLQDQAFQTEAEELNLTNTIKNHYANDVAILDVWPDGAHIHIGEIVNIFVEVENRGTSITPLFNVDVYAFKATDSNGFLVGTEQISLGPGQRQTLTFPLDTNVPDVNVGYYRIEAAAEVLEDEKFTADNTYTDGLIRVWNPYDLTAPTAPSNLNASVINSTVFLSWSAPPEKDVVGYKVYRSIQQEVIGTHIGYAADTYYNDTTVSPGTYWYSVKAYDVTGIESDACQSGQVQYPE